MVEIVSRAEWGARPPKTAPKKIAVPTKELWLHHTASPSGFAARVRSHQDWHMDVKGWNDIAYSFLINHTGLIYMGRGPGVAGGHTQGHNLVSHAICLMGNFNTTQPTEAYRGRRADQGLSILTTEGGQEFPHVIGQFAFEAPMAQGQGRLPAQVRVGALGLRCEPAHAPG